jgi:menaquinone-9 beta-reductase
MRRDPLIADAPLIIGGGPAGSAAAITLGLAGFRPVLVERTTGPTDKVCGDFLSIDTIQRARMLGVDPVALGAAPIHSIRLIHGERTAEAALPFPAFGLSRRVLDAALLLQAEHAGAIVQTGQTVRRLTADAGEWTAQTAGQAATAQPHPTAPSQSTARPHPTAPSQPQSSWPGVSGPPMPAPTAIAAPDTPAHDGHQESTRADTISRQTLTAETVFLATGKHDLRDMPRTRSDHGAIGMKIYFSPAPGPAKTLQGAIELTLFPGGYAGMQLVENGRAVLCIAVQRKAFQRYGGNWPALLAAIERGSRRFAAMLAGAGQRMARPLAVAGIPYGYQTRSPPPAGLFRLGDQAAVIPSLTGDGMAIALHSGRIAAETWLQGADSTAYHRTLIGTLAPQMRLAGLLHHACMNGTIQSAVIRGAALFPFLLRHASGRTRLPLEPSPDTSRPQG